jgi:large subunit ribosomal protein L29
MKLAELREKTVDDLKKELSALFHEQFKLRMKRATDQLKQTHLFRQVRHNIARVKTIIREKAGDSK